MRLRKADRRMRLMVCAVMVALVTALHSAKGMAATGHQAVSHSTATARPFAPAIDYGMVLAQYRKALNDYHTPETLTYIFSIDQAGSRGLSQTHVVYRSGLLVRDETTAMGSLSIKPHIHIYRSRAHHYAIESLAPRTTNYRFQYVSVHDEAGHVIYHFTTTPINPTVAFVVTSVDIDGTRFLPTDITFESRALDVFGQGHLHYGPIDDAWMILDAAADSRGGHGVLREHLVFTQYRFPKALPVSTFGAATP
jgi:hypothetical protein